MFLLRPSCPDDFITPDGKIKIYTEPEHFTFYTTKKNYENQCSSSCKQMGQNGQCDTKCNTMNCLYDNGECDDVAHQKLPKEAYHNAVMFVNYLLDSTYKYVFGCFDGASYPCAT